MSKRITDYTGEAFENFDPEDVQGLLKDRLEKGRERLEETREKVKALCEPVDPPRDSAAYIRFFCARDDGNLEQAQSQRAETRQSLQIHGGIRAGLRQSRQRNERSRL